MKTTVATFAAAKAAGRKLTMLTAYDYSFARLVDAAGVDSILVGDSLGNVILGYEATISVTMADMIHHTRAVTRGAKRALVVADMPFMSYQTSISKAVKNAGRLLKQGRAQAVKLEGGVVVADRIRAIVDASIPVVGHVGLTPQSVNAIGGFKVQGKSEESSEKLLADAIAVEAAGAFAVVVECVPPSLMKKLTESLSIPTIGIGAGPHCDGQVLVYHDLLGLFEGFSPKFARRYLEAGEEIKKAFAQFVADVKDGTFPKKENCFADPDEGVERMY